MILESVARSAGLEVFWRDPRAYARGYTLPPAPQARSTSAIWIALFEKLFLE